MKKLFENKVFKFLASIQLALPMILLISALLAAGTIVESRYSTAVAKRFVYSTWWFNLALLLLGINVLCSALSRFPWKKHQTGFVITHLGILIILAGSFVTQQFGVDGQIALNEGETGHVVQEEKPTLYYQIDHGSIEQIAAGFEYRAPSPEHPLLIDLPHDGLLMINQFFVNAQKSVDGRPAGPNEKGFPGVHVVLDSSFVHENQWLFLGDPNYGHLDLGPAAVFFEKEADWEKRRAKDPQSIAPNTLAVILTADNKLKYQTSHNGQFTPMSPVTIGTENPTGWMDMQFKVADRVFNAVPEESYKPVDFGYQKDLNPALHYEVISRGGRKEGWLGFQNQTAFMLAGSAFELAYGPRQLELPFTLRLVKFHLGLDPGTQKAASYASDIYYTDMRNPGQEVPYDISMNKPLHHDGFTVYQASYEPQPDGKYVSVFAVGQDPGLAVKYTGAIVLVLGIILMFWFKNPAWGKKEK